MQIAGKPMSSSSPPDWDWDKPLTEEDIEAIDAVFQSASASLNKRPQLPTSSRRRLPSSILRFNPFSYSPPATSPTVRFPEMKFGGQILYSRTSIEVERAATEILKTLKTEKKKMCQATLGLDIEWRPIFRRGALQRKVAVMQLCGASSQCHVMHIIHSGITPSLKLLLEDSTISKVGVGIAGDRTKVFKDYNVTIKALKDLSFLANQKLGGAQKNYGLASLTETLICRQLLKPNKIRLGNWEANVLSKEQLEYAATDAFASWHIYQVLKSLPDAEKDESINPIEESKSEFKHPIVVREGSSQGEIYAGRSIYHRLILYCC